MQTRIQTRTETDNNYYKDNNNNNNNNKDENSKRKLGPKSTRQAYAIPILIIDKRRDYHSEASSRMVAIN